MATKKSKIAHCSFKNTWRSKDGGTIRHYYNLEMENGDSGSGGFETLGQYKDGDTIEYEYNEIDKVFKIAHTKPATPPARGGGGSAPRNYSNGKRSPEDYLGFIYGYAKDIHIAEIQVTGKKVPLTNLKKNVEEMYAHIQQILNS
jgi:hypothetical protein